VETEDADTGTTDVVAAAQAALITTLEEGAARLREVFWTEAISALPS